MTNQNDFTEDMNLSVSDILTELNAMDSDSGSKAVKTDLERLKASDFIRVTISKDLFSATITLLHSPGKILFRKEDILSALKDAGVTSGIDMEAITRFLEKPYFNTPVTVANGEPCINGAKGYFEFLFQTSKDLKPRIQADGSVDYSSYDNICTVEADEELVHYVPAASGQNGLSVTGITIPARKGTDLPPLKGKGFYTSEDKRIYYAAIAGRPEYENNTLTVTNILEVETDVTHTTGNVVFSGDIHIRGSVYTGTIIQAGGCITVEGHVEGAQLIAGRDVVLKGGMQGGGKGSIRAGGIVQGKFFEHMMIQCKQDLTANSILNCTIRCYGTINVNGRLGIIVGGDCFALYGIHATMIGNMAEVKTSVSVGMDSFLQREKLSYEKKSMQLRTELEKIESGIHQLNELIARTERADLKQKKMLLFRAKVAKGSEINRLEQKLKDYQQMEENTQNSRISVSKSIYPRVTLSIHTESLVLTTENYNVTYKLADGEICTVPNT